MVVRVDVHPSAGHSEREERCSSAGEGIAGIQRILKCLGSEMSVGLCCAFERRPDHAVCSGLPAG